MDVASLAAARRAAEIHRIADALEVPVFVVEDAIAACRAAARAQPRYRPDEVAKYFVIPDDVLRAHRRSFADEARAA